MTRTQITPTPTDEEAAAIAAAVQVCWPRPVFAEEPAVRRAPTWRFSNRWWVKPVATRRSRPFR